MPRLARPTRCATWCDLESTLPSGNIDLFGSVVRQGATWQLAVALLSEYSREIGHGGNFECWEIRERGNVMDVHLKAFEPLTYPV